ncbi:hypothetical protein STSP2_00245 [Anaerohalosphaera lusitana]|uniref:Uncharacterized protein n=1 Tax=Anaerohalosphaera lusitana TaxID=1936003 RepID=A0A1U9NH88_9BACT|nr:hypothetical protein [Anaerohalosphaera lusitana]AQT67104.1 hypothetical protein STSP2_00245 [Anaerohalosphaera lusitana]
MCSKKYSSVYDAGDEYLDEENLDSDEELEEIAERSEKILSEGAGTNPESGDDLDEGYESEDEFDEDELDERYAEIDFGDDSFDEDEFGGMDDDFPEDLGDLGLDDFDD